MIVVRGVNLYPASVDAVIRKFDQVREYRVYKENVGFPNHFYIYKQPEGVNPWYIGYGMDGPKGYSRNLDTIHTL